jgi:hypothetical protein
MKEVRIWEDLCVEKQEIEGAREMYERKRRTLRERARSAQRVPSCFTHV